MAHSGNGMLSTVSLRYQLIRNTTSPDEAHTDVKFFIVNLPAFEILKLGTKENLREHIAEHNPKKRNRVHDAIGRTIRSELARFIACNSGFVIAVNEIDVDDHNQQPSSHRSMK